MIKYRPEIDGLRALAVVPVILFHAGIEAFSGGFVGVDIFFVISGFLITSILLVDIDRGTYSLLTFYERRARRILPALIFVILVTIPFSWAILLPADFANFGLSIIATMTFSSNVFFWSEINYFNPSAEYMPLLHTWSLAVEEQFYILFPPLLYLVMRRFASWLVAVACTFLLASFALAQFASGWQPSAAFFLLPTRIWELLIGSLVAIYVYRHGLPKETGSIGHALAILGLVLIVGSIVLLDEHHPFPSFYALPATVGTALIILFTQPGTLPFRLLSLRVIVGIGLISYSAYLWHQPLIALQRYRFPDLTYGPILMGALSIPLAWLSWRFVEAPFREKRVLPTRKACLSGAIAALAAFSMIGFGLTRNEGWVDRFTPEEQLVFAAFDDAESYVPKRFNALLGQEFSADNKNSKTLIIGDSYGQDLVNALYEADLTADLSLSTYQIPARCGNLLVEGLSEQREPQFRAECEKLAAYNDPVLLEKMAEADEIWFVSSWRPWSAPLLEESLSNIAKLTDAELTVFGRKHFGNRSLHSYYDGGIEGIIGERAVPEHLAEVQEWMGVNVPGFVDYIDLQLILCGDYHFCHNVDDNNRPVTFDGTHLTPEGALFLGHKLKDLL